MERTQLPAARSLIGLRAPRLTQAARVKAAATVWDMRALARRRAPLSVFDYTDGGAEAEVSLNRSRQAYRCVEFAPRVLRDVAEVDCSTSILDNPVRLPLALAPTGFTRLMHASGEKAVASAAARFGIPYSLSTLGTTSIADLRNAVPTSDTWFQLYVWKDRSFASELINRAKEHGCRALILTVDVPVAGARLRDVRNGLTIPPRLGPRTMIDIARRPAWWWDLLTSEPLRFASLDSSAGTVAELINRVFDPSVTFEDLSWLRGTWTGPLIVKGVQTVVDAQSVRDIGADALIVSNHGGRQLDRAPTTLATLPQIVDAVGTEMEVYVDGGITSGADIAAAIAFGAKACMIGRAYLYGLMAGGEAGVTRVLEILATEYLRTLRLLGVGSTAELGRQHVRLLPGCWSCNCGSH